jgi:hypothetical protein
MRLKQILDRVRTNWGKSFVEEAQAINQNPNHKLIQEVMKSLNLAQGKPLKKSDAEEASRKIMNKRLEEYFTSNESKEGDAYYISHMPKTLSDSELLNLRRVMEVEIWAMWILELVITNRVTKHSRKDWKWEQRHLNRTVNEIIVRRWASLGMARPQTNRQAAAKVVLKQPGNNVMNIQGDVDDGREVAAMYDWARANPPMGYNAGKWLFPVEAANPENHQ